MNSILDTIFKGQKIPATIVGMLCIIIGLIIAALATMIYLQNKFRSRRHSAKTSGTITGWKSYELGEHTDDFPIVEFKPKNSDTISLISKFNATSIPDADNAPKNMPVIVYYNPNDPSEFSITKKQIPIGTIIINIIGIVICALGIYIIFYV